MDNSDQVNIPDIYFDGIKVTVTAVGVNFSLTLNDPHPDTANTDKDSKLRSKPILIARTSLEHAKILVMLLKKQLKLYENKTDAVINLPKDVYKGLELDEKEWQ